MEETGNSSAGTSSGDDANRRRSPGVVATLVMIAMFAFGALAGVALDRHLVHARGGGRDRGEGPRFVPGMSMPSNPRSSAAGRDSMRPRGGGEFAKALGLSATQAAAVDSVMAQDFKAVSALREEMRPRIESIIASTRQRIDSLLTPQQREKYHALIAEQQQRMQRRERGGPRRGGGGGGPPF